MRGGRCTDSPIRLRIPSCTPIHRRERCAKSDRSSPRATQDIMAGPPNSNIIDFLLLVGNLKRTQRTGWVHNKVKDPESIADHMYRMSVMGMLCDDPTLDRTRCVKMALAHDLAESIVGDITPNCGVSDEDKSAREDAAMRHIRDNLLSGNAAGQELYSLWREYEDNTTPESKFVKDLDKFDMILQAFEYEKEENRAGQLESFFKSTRGRFTTAQVQGWVGELYARRDGLLSNNTANGTSGQS